MFAKFFYESRIALWSAWLLKLVFSRFVALDTNLKIHAVIRRTFLSIHFWRSFSLFSLITIVCNFWLTLCSTFTSFVFFIFATRLDTNCFRKIFNKIIALEILPYIHFHLFTFFSLIYCIH